jgi:hypothetical protein
MAEFLIRHGKTLVICIMLVLLFCLYMVADAGRVSRMTECKTQCLSSCAGNAECIKECPGVCSLPRF